MNHVFEECPIFQAQQQFPEPMNAAFSRPNNNLTHKRTILTGELTRISHGAKTIMTTHGQTIQATSIILIILPIINPTFLIIITILTTICPTFQIINKTFLTNLHSLPSRILNLKGE